MSSEYVHAWILNRRGSDECVVLPKISCNTGKGIENILTAGNWSTAIALYLSKECFDAVNGPGSKGEIIAIMREHPENLHTADYLEAAF